jgi:hypothetical protein
LRQAEGVTIDTLSEISGDSSLITQIFSDSTQEWIGINLDQQRETVKTVAQRLAL